MTIWTARERAVLDALGTPQAIQRYLDRLAYDRHRGARSPRGVMRQKSAHCFGGALLAAAALERRGEPPLLMYLAAAEDDDHVVAVYRRGGCWGAIGKSHFVWLRSRAPVYRTLRELALSYFEGYFDRARRPSLRGYCHPVDLRRFEGWHIDDEALPHIQEALQARRQYPLLTPGMARGLRATDARSYRANRF